MSAPANAASAALPSMPPSLNSSLTPFVWRAGRMGIARSTATPTGYPLLNRELPDGGWPHGGLIELLLQQTGIGEMRLLQPALQALGNRRIALLQPPHLPHIAAWRDWGLPAQRLLWVRAPRHADAVWSAEQILRNGSCGALLFWPPAIRHESLRRLQLAAQASDMVCWLLRPLSAAAEASPAPLRIAVRPLAGSVQVDIVKRRGPQSAAPLALRWPDRPGLINPMPIGPDEASDALLDRRQSAVAATAVAVSALV